MEISTVVLIDDHPLIREGLRDLINSNKDMLVVGEAENGVDGLKIIRQKKPCTAIVDIALPDINGIEITKQICQLSVTSEKPIHVIILTMFLKENLVYHTLKAGAKGYVVKSSPSIEIITAIRRVCEGQYYLDSQVASNIIPEYMKGRSISHPQDEYDLLTEREQQIFRLLAEGHSNRFIADILCISPKTVERHRANIMTKLDVHNFRDLLKTAIKIGLLDHEISTIE
jgi:DNA-binding NarL/FixJ family response regulator